MSVNSAGVCCSNCGIVYARAYKHARHNWVWVLYTLETTDIQCTMMMTQLGCITIAAKHTATWFNMRSLNRDVWCNRRSVYTRNATLQRVLPTVPNVKNRATHAMLVRILKLHHESDRITYRDPRTCGRLTVPFIWCHLRMQCVRWITGLCEMRHVRERRFRVDSTFDLINNAPRRKWRVDRPCTQKARQFSVSRRSNLKSPTGLMLYGW